jgi:hypothetical protein
VFLAAAFSIDAQEAALQQTTPDVVFAPPAHEIPQMTA